MKNKFELPNTWYVKVTKSNRKILSKWRYGNTNTTFNLLELNHLAGININRKGHLEKGHNPAHLVKEESYDFGIEITTAQFKKYVLNEKIYKTKDYNYLLPVLKKLNLK